MNWINPSSQSQNLSLVRGAFATPIAQLVNDTTASVLVPAAVTGQYFSISNAGPKYIYLRFGDDATTSVYNVVIPPGFNDNQIHVAANEKVTAICDTGETATVMVAIAPEVRI